MSNLVEILKGLDKIWEKMFHLCFQVEGKGFRKIIGNETKVCELESQAREIIFTHQGFLLNELALEVATIRRYGSLSDVPLKVIGRGVRSNMRFTTAWNVILSLN